MGLELLVVNDGCVCAFFSPGFLAYYRLSQGTIQNYSWALDIMHTIDYENVLVT